MNTQLIQIDLSYLNSLVQGDQAFAKLLLTTTVKDIEVKMSSFADCWENRDAVGLKSAAHSIISLSAIAGLPAISGWCRSIEQGLKAGGFQPELENLIHETIVTWSDALPELREMIED